MPTQTKRPQPVAPGAGSQARVSRKENAQQPKYTTAAARRVRVSRRDIGSVWIGAIRGVLAGQIPVRVPEGAGDLPGQGDICVVIGPGAWEWARRRRQTDGHALVCVPGVSPRAYRWPVRDRRVEVVALADGQMPEEPIEEFARWLLVRWSAVRVRVAGDYAPRIFERGISDG